MIGISTACFYPLETEKAFAALCAMGVPAAEIFFNAAGELSPGFLRELRAKGEAAGVKILAIHPFTSGMEPYFLFSRYRRRFLETLDFYRRYNEAARFLNARVVVIHGGRPANAADSVSDEEYIERFGRLAARGREDGVVVAQENVVNFRSGSADFIRRMRETLGETAAFTLDIKQAVRAGEDPFPMAEAMGDRLVHLHLSDHLRGPGGRPENGDVTCLLPGRGDFPFADWFRYLAARGYAGDMALEVYRSAFEEPEELKKSLLWLSAQNAG